MTKKRLSSEKIARLIIGAVVAAAALISAIANFIK